ncbi:putative Snf1 kinase complex beta-subunit Gal83 [Aspergillus lucknowensis]|uniref:Association with the SNF1 complex (ASC) domain-containing protein n=1 Tax=Aspergillus lucknowensis TaxID=176173 RepID=A0ABR4M3Y3_9EURO
MGNNPSKGSPGDGPSPVTLGTTSLTASTSDKRAARGSSLNAPPGAAKAPVADPSASKEIATGQSSSHIQAPPQHRFRSRNVADLPPQTGDRQDHHEPMKTSAPRSRDIQPPDPSNPVQVPISRSAAPRRDPHESVAPSGPPHKMYYSMSAHLQRPPRMPLPIGDATATPGSPISGPDDASPLAPDQNPSDTIGVTNPDITTIEDDDTVDELQQYANHGGGRAVPATIEWTGGGNKVYVTGTFVNWEKKFRLHRSENNPGVMFTKLNLRPGTHHLKFLVDNEMRVSDNLPTAVDFTNHLVNYIELSAGDANRSRRESDKSPGQLGVDSPDVFPGPAADGKLESAVDEDKSDKEEPEEIPSGDFRNIIPPFLLDLDKDEESASYQQAVNIIGDAPTPPSLPLFLGKSILNGTTPMKDDSSLLNNPNHTVLNHLATSSIKNGVLATSVTTRYKRKYVTTILYKPTGDIGE